jgi:hypothetical protein
MVAGGERCECEKTLVPSGDNAATHVRSIDTPEVRKAQREKGSSFARISGREFGLL